MIIDIKGKSTKCNKKVIKSNNVSNVTKILKKCIIAWKSVYIWYNEHKILSYNNNRFTKENNGVRNEEKNIRYNWNANN